MDLSPILLSLGSATFEVTRRPPGYRHEGIYVEATPVTVDVGPASIQPVSSKSIPLPEGVRAEDAKTLFCTSLVRGAEDPEGYMGDRFEYLDRTFEVQAVRDWAAEGMGNFYEALAVRVRDSEAAEA